jgi:hypothetical protein
MIRHLFVNKAITIRANPVERPGSDPSTGPIQSQQGEDIVAAAVCLPPAAHNQPIISYMPRYPLAASRPAGPLSGAA